MSKLILIRAGQTDWQVQGRLVGDTDLKLNEAGRHEASERAAVAKSMMPTMLYCGEDSPAMETAGIVGKALNLKVRKQKAFREMDLGHWEGLTTEQFRDRFPKIYRQWHNDPLAVEPPNGESITTVMERITNRLTRLMKKSDDQTVVLVLGGFAHAALRCEFSGNGFDAFWEYVKCEDSGIETIDTVAVVQPVGDDASADV